MPLAFLFTGPSHWQNTRFPTLTVVARQQPMTCIVNVRAFNNHPDTAEGQQRSECKRVNRCVISFDHFQFPIKNPKERKTYSLFCFSFFNTFSFFDYQLKMERTNDTRNTSVTYIICFAASWRTYSMWFSFVCWKWCLDWYSSVEGKLHCYITRIQDHLKSYQGNFCWIISICCDQKL